MRFYPAKKLLRAGPAITLFAAIVSTPAVAQVVTVHDFLTVGEKSGEQVVTQRPDGRLSIDFSFNDRGRGPETSTHVTLDQRGFPASLSITGLNYVKAEVNETYSQVEGNGRWQSAIESGSTDEAESRFFWPANAPPEFAAILARALLRDEDGELPLLPSGTARIEKQETRTITNASGDERTVTLYAINGLGDAPAAVWLDAELNLYGADYGWFAITPKGWGDSYQTLKKVQSSVEDQRLFEATSRLKTDLVGLAAFTDVDIFDSIKGEIKTDKTVYVMDGVISAIVDAHDAMLEDAHVVDGSGLTMVPGLWDMHGHVSSSNYFNYLAMGVTSVRDMANDPDFIVDTRQAIRANKLAGPDIYALGFIDKDSEFAAPTGMLANSLDEAIEFVDFYARHGFVGIKLYSSIEPGWVAPIAEHAHSLGLTVQGHVPAYMLASEAIKDGYDELTHINMAMLDLLAADDVDTRTPLRFTVPGSQGANIDVEGAAMDALVELMRSTDTAIEPTLSIFLDMFLNEPGEFQASHKLTADHYPPGIRRSVLSSRGRNYGDEDNYAQAAATAQAMVKRFFDEGITVLAGTDNSPWGFALISELHAYVDAGIPEASVLQMATIGAARHMGQDQSLGSITVGKRAHFVLVQGNPLDGFEALLRTRRVVKDQSMYSTLELLRAQGYLPFE